MKITKKALAIILSILMLTAVMPIAVSAAGAVEYSADGVTYQNAPTLADAFASVSDGGFVKLNDNITVDRTVTVDKNVTLFGNGFTVMRSDGFTGAVFVSDYSGSTPIKAFFYNTVVEGNRNSVNANYPLFNIKGGEIHFTAVSLINNKSSNNGGGVSVGTETGSKKAFLALDSASKIINCSASYGGAVIILKNGEVVSNGAVIKACSSSNDGGAVCLARQGAKMTMNAGSITGCSAQGWGGAISNEIGTLVLNGVTIKDNFVYNGGLGGAVFANQYKADGTNDSSITLAGACVITDNYSVASDGTHNASNLYIYTKDAGNDIPKIKIADDFAPAANVSITVDDSNVNANDFLTGDLSKIHNNLVSDTEGYFYSYNSETGSADYKQGTKIILNAAGGTCDNKFIYADSVYGDLPKPYKVNYAFAGWFTASVGGTQITADTPITSDSPRTLYAHWNIAEITYVKNGKTYGAMTLDEAVEEAQDGGIITVFKNTAISKTVVIDKNIAIKSASGANISTISRSVGFKGTMFSIGSQGENPINFNLSNIIIDGAYVYPAGTAEEDMLAVETGSVLQINKSIADISGVTIKNSYAARYCSAIVVNSASADVTMDSSIIESCTSPLGGAVKVVSGKFTLSNSEIKSCNASQSGGALYIDGASAECTLINDKITGCSAKAYGGAVCLNEGTLTVNSASITSNNVASNGKGGAVAVYPAATFNIKGLVNISGNYCGKIGDDSSFEQNVYFIGESKVNVTGALDINSEIGISSDSEFSDGKTINCIETASDVPASSVTGIFFTDTGKLYVFPQGSSFAVWEAYKVTLDPNKSTCDVPYIIVQSDAFLGELPVPAGRDGFTFAGWFDSPKYGTGKQYTENSTVNSDITLYAQWSNDNALDNNPLAVIGRFFTRIGEIMKIVFNFLKNLFSGRGGIDDIITNK